MIRKQYPQQLNDYRLTDAVSGSGNLSIQGVGQQRYVQDPVSSSHYGYRGGHYEYDQYRVAGTTTPESYPLTFGLKRYADGSILPSSIEGATQVPTMKEAEALIAQWLAAGGPGLALESPEETKRRHLEATSAFAYGKASYWLSRLTDADLLKLSEEAANYAVKRAERAEKARLRVLEKQRKAEEKIQKAAEKAAAKAAAKIAQDAKKAEMAQKAADRAAAKAVRDAEKARKQAAKNAGVIVAA